MIHDFSPFAWKFSNEIGIRWYGLSYLMAFVFAYLIVQWMARRQRQGLGPSLIFDATIYAAMGTLIGGRLGYCVFYAPDLFIKFKSDFPFWGVLAVNEGGMASHGGIIGLAISLVLFGWKHNVNRLYLFDLAALTGSLGIFFGRLANFMNGELVGRKVESSFVLATKFPQDILSWPQYEPGKLSGLGPVVSSIPDLKMSAVDWKMLTDSVTGNPANQMKVVSILHQILEAIQDGNESAKSAIAPLLEYRHPSQLYGAFGEGLFIFLFLFILWYKPRRSGLISAWFVILYSLVRLMDEQFRLPDLQLGYRWLDLTQGQWLSVGMLIFGLWWMVMMVGRREAIPSPGWGLGPNVRIHRRQ